MLARQQGTGMGNKTDKETLLSFLKDRPIAYHPILAKKLKSVKAAVFLSQLLYWCDKGKSPDGWIYKNAGDFYDETGLSREEQETARKKLLEKKLIQHELRGVPATSNYRVLEQNYIDFLSENDNQIGEKIQSRLDKTPKLDCTKPPNLIGENSQTELAETAKLDWQKPPNHIIDYSEITSDITSETTSSSSAAKNGNGKQPKNGDGDDVLFNRILALNSEIQPLGVQTVLDLHSDDLTGFAEYLTGIEAAGIPAGYTPARIIAALKKKLPMGTTAKPEKIKNGGW
jgi:hypothetical protein